ncbi:hypothetical protein EJ04DRAFT_527902 [Polyplosphaeria fusca]|uniref:DUF7165 domain-containing protein n=1 Tax=Polyplosphaeria fusca TaxID=682080 RepID=A0A9P4QPV7_9PLEO|nr:hypothetical protein EJ04DRAFT_527902 [Polyplosphaeria fusca]
MHACGIGYGTGGVYRGPVIWSAPHLHRVRGGCEFTIGADGHRHAAVAAVNHTGDGVGNCLPATEPGRSRARPPAPFAGASYREDSANALDCGRRAMDVRPAGTSIAAKRRSGRAKPTWPRSYAAVLRRRDDRHARWSPATPSPEPQQHHCPDIHPESRVRRQKMTGRRGVQHENGNLLAIRTDVRAKTAAREDGAAKHANADGFPRTASLTSLATSADNDDSHNTHLSASSTGNDTLSTARTSTSGMTEDEGPSASYLQPAPSKYAPPVTTVLELVSNTASSSALPDSFSFNISRKGNFVAIYTASNIWLIKATQLPRLWARTLEVKRKPIAIDVQENGTLMAVLSRTSQVDIYEMPDDQHRQIKKRRTISLVHEAHTLVMSPDGLVLITGNKFGIEVISIGPNAPESTRRTLSAPAGDTLEFSDDGRTLLITGYARKLGISSMYVLPGLYDGPMDEEGEPIPVSPDTVWTGSVLFPETAKIARQATLLPDAETNNVNELFAFNADEDTWGVYDITSARFTSRKMFLPDQQRWTRSEFIDDAMPAVSPSADLAAVALRIRGTTSIWIYQVPEWDFMSKPKDAEQLSPIQPCFCIPILHDSAESNQEIGVLRWVRLNDSMQRLIAVGNINPKETETEGPNVPQGSKGVVIILDFDGNKLVGGTAPVPTKMEYDLDTLLPGEKLPEGAIDFDREVELVRTRTLAQRRAHNEATPPRRSSRHIPTPGRANTSVARDRPTSIRPPTIVRDDEEELNPEEVQAAFEAPYDNTQPRSQNSLARAATVAALSPANRRHLRALPFRPLEYRRADGLREFPHESDADNWVPPPPAYTATADAAQSISLSHPDAPPAAARARGPVDAGVPPVPPLPTNANSSPVPNNPYPSSSSRRGTLSQSSTDLSSTSTVTERRPSLLHPSTYPSPLSPSPSRRRSSAAQQGPPQPHPQPPSNQTAYQATASNMAARRPTRRPRRAVESTIDLRPPPIVDPASGRRGSAPDTVIHRRPVLTNPLLTNRASMPSDQSGRSSNLRNAMLPRLRTATEGGGRPGPLSAPPRTHTGQMRPHTQPATVKERKSPSKKKLQCVVM